MANHAGNTFNHRTSTDSEGRIYYDAPIVIDGQEALDNFHITRKDCVLIRFGGYDPTLVYFCSVESREVAEYYWSALNREHAEKIKVTRCMVPGERKALKRCPTSNSCEHCPFGKTPADKRLNQISWERMVEEAYEKESSDGNADSPVAEMGDFHLLLRDMQQRLDMEDSRLMKVLLWKYQTGLSAKEIAERLGCSEPRVYQLLTQALEMAREYGKSCE